MVVCDNYIILYIIIWIWCQECSIIFTLQDINLALSTDKVNSCFFCVFSTNNLDWKHNFVCVCIFIIIWQIQCFKNTFRCDCVIILRNCFKFCYLFCSCKWFNNYILISNALSCINLDCLQTVFHFSSIFNKFDFENVFVVVIIFCDCFNNKVTIDFLFIWIRHNKWIFFKEWWLFFNFCIYCVCPIKWTIWNCQRIFVNWCNSVNLLQYCTVANKNIESRVCILNISTCITTFNQLNILFCRSIFCNIQCQSLNSSLQVCYIFTINKLFFFDKWEVKFWFCCVIEIFNSNICFSHAFLCVWFFILCNCNFVNNFCVCVLR